MSATKGATMQTALQRIPVAAAALIALIMAFASFGTDAKAQTPADEEHWQLLKEDIFGETDVVEDLNFVDVHAPLQADDGALVPVSFSIPTHVARKAKTVTLVVDKNPAPIAAKFTFGDAAGLAERRIETRIRLQEFSNVRAVVEMDDGKMYMNTKYVKAAGGCASPNSKDLDESLASYGKVKVKWVAEAETAKKYTASEFQSFPMAEARVMIKHPNYSGMQQDPKTGKFIPAKVVDSLTVSKGKRMIFKMEGGISISENPNFRFTYEGGGDEPIIVKASDNDGDQFEMQAIRSGS